MCRPQGEGGWAYHACVVAGLKIGQYTTQEAAYPAAGWLERPALH
jgi:hypothetical protein